ncbi:hypothetical protein, partial [Alloscardovia omnicolens]|uniref:hypothetical protein n=1 Tax=Alloscardovia omnicolens TaxID=419015 RepID=UPI00254CCCAE
ATAVPNGANIATASTADIIILRIFIFLSFSIPRRENTFRVEPVSLKASPHRPSFRLSKRTGQNSRNSHDVEKKKHRFPFISRESDVILWS